MSQSNIVSIASRRCVASDSAFPVYEDGSPAGHARGWKVYADGSWTAFYGPHRDGGKTPDEQTATRIAAEWCERAQRQWGER